MFLLLYLQECMTMLTSSLIDEPMQKHVYTMHNVEYVHVYV